MKRLSKAIDDGVVEITARKDGSAWSVVGFGHTTSVRSTFCDNDHARYDFANVLLFACNIDRTAANIEAVCNMVEELLN